jgi:hypothetical protein
MNQIIKIAVLIAVKKEIQELKDKYKKVSSEYDKFDENRVELNFKKIEEKTMLEFEKMIKENDLQYFLKPKIILTLNEIVTNIADD